MSEREVRVTVRVRDVRIVKDVISYFRTDTCPGGYECARCVASVSMPADGLPRTC